MHVSEVPVDSGCSIHYHKSMHTFTMLSKGGARNLTLIEHTHLVIQMVSNDGPSKFIQYPPPPPLLDSPGLHDLLTIGKANSFRNI